MSGVSAFGNDWQSVEPKLRDWQNATHYMRSYEQYDGWNTKLAAGILDFELA
ncbi:beta-ketoacyl-ACP synthase, partial [Vibrio parahaemolyticus]|nr:beta-ketoacyl-ACP synthase [Vibrio parahaemolyticus]